MSQRPGPSTLKIEVPLGYPIIFEASADLNYDDFERAFCLNLPTTKLFIMSRQAHRYNQERRDFLNLDAHRESLSYGDEVQGTQEPNKFSKSDLFRAMASNDRSRLQVSVY